MKASHCTLSYDTRNMTWLSACLVGNINCFPHCKLQDTYWVTILSCAGSVQRLNLGLHDTVSIL